MNLKSWYPIMSEIIRSKSDFRLYEKLFLEINGKINLVSKNEEQYLYEKHICDSLSIKLFFEKYDFIPKTLLDIGTGGGFPAVPIAFSYPQISITALDSIRKKIDAISYISKNLGLKNIRFVQARIENFSSDKFDVITSRAVGKLAKLVKYAYPHLNKDGYMVFYKSKSASEELNEAAGVIKKMRLKILPLIRYNLPLEENFERCLVILQKNNEIKVL